jgi:hypothetical protein
MSIEGLGSYLVWLIWRFLQIIVQMAGLSGFQGAGPILLRAGRIKFGHGTVFQPSPDPICRGTIFSNNQDRQWISGIVYDQDENYPQSQSASMQLK